MPFSRWLLMGSVVQLLFIFFMPAFSSATIPTTVKKLNDSARLSCNKPCSGVVQFRRDGEEVAECGSGAAAGFGFTCEVKNGEAHFNVSSVTFLTRGFYSTFCDGQEMFNCRQILQIIPPEDDLELDAGGHLEIDLHIPKPVNIQLTRPGHTSAVQLCRVIGRLHQCAPEYQQRVYVVGNVFVLLEMKPSDSGNYSVREEDHTLVNSITATVRERSSSIRNPISPERAIRDPTHVFISTVNDVQESGIWRDGFRNGSNDGYLKGMRDVALVGLAAVVGAFFLGVVVGQKVRPPLSVWVQKLGVGRCLQENLPGDLEMGVPLNSDGSLGTF